MALIELNLEKPALKRTEVASDEEAETEEAVAGTEEELEVTDEGETSESEAETTESGGRLRRTGRTVALLGAGVVGLLTLRKLRGRGKDETAEDEE